MNTVYVTFGIHGYWYGFIQRDTSVGLLRLLCTQAEDDDINKKITPT